jgi:hypothetical protein
MTHSQAKKYLARAERRGYVAYHNGIVMEETEKRYGGNTTGTNWGINIDGDGHNGRLFSCPQIIWSAEQAEEKFPK